MEKTIDIEKLVLEIEFIKKALNWKLHNKSRFSCPSELWVTIEDEGARNIIKVETDYQERRFELTDEEFEILNRK